MGVDTVFFEGVSIPLILDDLDIESGLTEDEFWSLFHEGVREELLKYSGRIYKDWIIKHDKLEFYPDSRAHRGGPEYWIPYLLLILRVIDKVAPEALPPPTHIPYFVVYAGTGAGGILYISYSSVKIMGVDDEGEVRIEHYEDADLDDEKRWAGVDRSLN